MNSETKKIEVFKQVRDRLKAEGLEIINEDSSRPWGGFFVLAEDQAQRFADIYFNGIQTEDLKISGKLSPKVLLVGPNMRLSWQYHYRRAEIWQVIDGPVGVAISKSDEQTKPDVYQAGDRIILEKGERHRLVGLDNWGIVAEIWRHTDPENPSDELDIVRVQDDFGR